MRSNVPLRSTACESTTIPTFDAICAVAFASSAVAALLSAPQSAVTLFACGNILHIAAPHQLANERRALGAGRFDERGYHEIADPRARTLRRHESRRRCEQTHR